MQQFDNRLAADITDAFNHMGIKPKQSINSLDLINMAASVTNKFIIVTAHDEKKYLVRINGKLWPPFSRETEASNLSILSKNNISHNVIYNAPKHGFQICALPDKNTQTQRLGTDKPTSLSKVGKALRQLHQIRGVQNEYYIDETLKQSFTRLDKTVQQSLKPYYDSTQQMLSVLGADNSHRVTSHNDLLPSSVYQRNDDVYLVDWEYAGRNHFLYDLALFSIKSGLSQHDDHRLLSSYDLNMDNHTNYLFLLMKTSVSFLILNWHLTTNPFHQDMAELITYTCQLQHTLTTQAGNNILSELKLSTTATNEQEEDEQLTVFSSPPKI